MQFLHDIFYYFRYMYRYCYYFMLLLLATSCNKKNEDTTPVGDFRFKNTLEQSVNIDIYATIEDYHNATNIFKKIQVTANGSYHLPLSSFEKDKDYYLDWYTDDYKQGNWIYPIEIDTVYHYIPIRPLQNTSYTIQPTMDFSIFRKALLNTTGSGTTWIAVAKTNGLGGNPSPMPQGTNLKIEFKKDLKYTKQATGITTTKWYEPLQYQSGSSAVRLDNLEIMWISMYDSIGYYQFKTLDSAVYHNLSDNFNPQYYLMVKEK